jgi:hypothetical protein
LFVFRTAGKGKSGKRYKPSEFELSEVRVGVELTAQGGVNLIGNLTAGAKGAMELTFKPAAEEKATKK